MEAANKQGSEECLKKARQRFKDRDLSGSLRMANKSLRMCESKEAQELVEKIELQMASGPSNADVEDNDEVRRRRRRGQEGESTQAPNSASAEPSYTPQQQEAVDRVMQCADFYKVLSVDREVSVDAIKKSYRKLALQLHPDKNQAPRADEAFKKVSRAYDTLCSEDKRAAYDRYGEQGLQPNAGGGGGGRNYYTTTDDFDADRLFREFFGFNSFGQNFGTTTFYFDDGSDNFVSSNGPRHRVHRTRIDNRRGSSVFFTYLIFIIPMFFMFVLPTLIELFTPVEFKLEKYSDYNVKREFKYEKMTLLYYVKRDFDSSQYSVKRVERNVLLEYMDRHLKRCQRQQMEKTRAQYAARTSDQLQKAKSMSTKDCDSYHKLLQARA